MKNLLNYAFALTILYTALATANVVSANTSVGVLQTARDVVPRLTQPVTAVNVTQAQPVAAEQVTDVAVGVQAAGSASPTPVADRGVEVAAAVLDRT